MKRWRRMRRSDGGKEDDWQSVGKIMDGREHRKDMC